MASQVISFPAKTFNYISFIDYKSWSFFGAASEAPQIIEALAPAGTTRYLLDVGIFGRTGRLRMTFGSIAGGSGGGGDDLTDEFEMQGSVILSAADLEVTVDTGGDISTEPYDWTPDNSAELITLYNALQTTPGSEALTLTLRDVTPLTTVGQKTHALATALKDLGYWNYSRSLTEDISTLNTHLHQMATALKNFGLLNYGAAQGELPAATLVDNIGSALAAYGLLNYDRLAPAVPPRWLDPTGDPIEWTINQPIQDYVVPAADEGTLPIIYSAVNLPTGLEFDPVTRTISGTPTALGSSNVAVTGTNVAGNAVWGVTATVVAVPFGVTIDGVTTELDEGAERTFDAVPVGATDAVTYAWEISGDATISGAADGVSVRVVANSVTSAGGEFTLKVTATHQGAKVSASVTVDVRYTRGPTFDIFISGTVTEMDEGELATFRAVLPRGSATGPITYLWSVSGNGVIVGIKTGSSVRIRATNVSSRGGRFTITLKATRQSVTDTVMFGIVVHDTGGPDPEITTKPDVVYRTALGSDPSTVSRPTGGTNLVGHTPRNWQRSKPAPTTIRGVFRSRRTLTFVDGVFTEATNWGAVELADPPDDDGGTTTDRRTQYIYILAESTPRAPAGGTSDEFPSIGSWQRRKLEPTATKNVYRARRTATYEVDSDTGDEEFRSATAWGNVEKIADAVRVVTTRPDTIYRKATGSDPSAVPRPTGGESSPRHLPSGWSRTAPSATETQGVFSSTRTLTYINGDFDSATAWGSVEVEEPAIGRVETRPEYIYLLAESKPSAPRGGQNTPNHEPGNWRSREPAPTSTRNVYRAERTVTTRNRRFIGATAWGSVTKVADATRTTRTDTDRIHGLFESFPGAPSGGQDIENHEPAGWDRARTPPVPTETEGVYRATRTRTYVNGLFTHATAWGNVRLISPATGDEGDG